MNWTEMEKTGVSLMDRDSFILRQQAALLETALTERDIHNIEASIKFLADFFPQMLIREERLMVLKSYKGLNSHRTDHRALSSRLTSAVAGGAQDPVTAGKRLIACLKLWVTEHVEAHDHDFAIHLRGQTDKPEKKPKTQTLSEKAKTIDWAGLSAMIIEPELSLRVTIKRMVRTLGIPTIMEAKDVFSAMTILRDTSVDLVLVSEDIPPMDGPGIAQEFRDWRTSPAPEVILVLMTGETITRDHLLNCLRAGVHDIIKKPISQQTLNTRLVRQLANPLPFKDQGHFRLPVFPERLPDPSSLAPAAPGQGAPDKAARSKEDASSKASTSVSKKELMSNKASLPAKEVWDGFSDH
ncbi:MAG: response regulator [Rhodospirillaceae bacterium]